MSGDLDDIRENCKVVRKRTMISNNEYIENWTISYGSHYMQQKMMSIEEIIKLLQSLGPKIDLHLQCDMSHDFMCGDAEELKSFLLSVNINKLIFEGQWILPRGDWSYLMNAENIKHVECEEGALSGLTPTNDYASFVKSEKRYK